MASPWVKTFFDHHWWSYTTQDVSDELGKLRALGVLSKAGKPLAKPRTKDDGKLIPWIRRIKDVV